MRTGDILPVSLELMKQKKRPVRNMTTTQWKFIQDANQFWTLHFSVERNHFTLHIYLTQFIAIEHWFNMRRLNIYCLQDLPWYIVTKSFWKLLILLDEKFHVQIWYAISEEALWTIRFLIYVLVFAYSIRLANRFGNVDAGKVLVLECFHTKWKHNWFVYPTLLFRCAQL